ncbi:MAG TPA: glycosyltransferase family 4 protein [Nitrospiraceae bacterium]|nr:glycosyltransferase family 4 protein [Nitrospiraceae bacterium]
MKILVISAAYPPMQAGEATNAYHLCRHLAERGMEIHVLTSCGNEASADPRIQVHPIMREWSWWELVKLRSFIKRCAPQAVYVMYIGLMYNFHPMITFAVTVIKSLFPKIPVVTRYESAFVGADPSKTSLTARIFRRLVGMWAGGKDVAYSSGTLLRDSDYIIALCERHREKLTEEWPAVRAKIRIIPPPPNMCVVPRKEAARQRGRGKLGLKEEHFVIAFFGYLYRTKGIEFLLQAFKLVQAERKNVKLLFIGGKVGLKVEGSADYFERMQEMARLLHIEQNVIWTGPVKSDEEEGSLYLHAADIAVLPFLQGVQLNNSSLASIAAHGLPIIGTRGPLPDSAFIDGSNILLCEPEDSQAIARSILQLMDDRALHRRLKEGVEKLGEDWFSWDKAIDQTLVMFQPR